MLPDIAICDVFAEGASPQGCENHVWYGMVRPETRINILTRLIYDGLFRLCPHRERGRKCTLSLL